MIRVLDAKLESGTEDPRVLALATALDLEDGERERAIRRLLRQIDRRIAAGVVHLQRSQALKAQGNESEARRRDARAQTVRGELAGIARYVATLSLESENVARVIAGLRGARATGLIDGGGHMWLGRLQLGVGNAREARRSYERALAEGVDDAWLKNDLALLLAKQGIELERATALAEQAMAAHPDRADVIDTLGFVHLRSGRPERALEQFRHAVRLMTEAGQPRADFQYHLGLAYAALGRLEEAAEAFDQALALDPGMQVAADARAALQAPARAELRVDPS